MSLKSGTNSFHGVGYDFMRRKALAANSFLLNSRQAPKTDQYIDQYGFSVDGPIFKNKTFFLFTGEKYREGTPAPLNSTTPTAAMKNGDFSGLVDAQGRQIVIYDPATGRDVNGVWTRDPFPGNRIPGRPHQLRGAGDHAVLPGPELHHRRRRALAEQPATTPSTSTRTCSGTGSARSITTSAPTTAPSSAGARTSATRCATPPPIRSGPAQDGQLPLWRANRALVGDWVHIFGPGTVFNLRGSYTYFLEWSYSQDALGFDSTTFGWPSSLVGQMPSQAIGGMFPRIEVEQFVEPVAGQRPRTGTGTTRFSRTCR